MTVQATIRQAGPFPGDSLATVFPFAFKCFAASDIVATLTTIASGAQSTLVLNTDYTVALNADQDAAPGGSITYNPLGVPMPATLNLTLTSSVPQTQTLTLTNGGGFFPLVISAALDRCVILIQQLALTISRGLTVAIGDTTPGSLPTAAARALKFLAFDVSGNPIASAGGGSTPVSAGMAAVVAAATVSAGRTALGIVTPPRGRLTLTTGVPVTTADITAVNTVFYSPYNGSTVPVYNGTAFVDTTFTEMSQLTTDATKSPAAVANNSNYDMFVWSDAGTLRCTRGPAWTSDTGRGAGAGTSELQQVQGVNVNKNAITNGPGAGLGTYVGSIRSGATALLEDSAANRYLWNGCNRVLRKLKAALETADTWLYSTAVIRQANGSTANQLNFLVGLAEDAVSAQMVASARSDQAASTVQFVVGIGLDSTTAIHADCLRGVQNNIAAGLPSELYASVVTYPGIGKHSLTQLEYVTAVGNTTWVGDNGQPAQVQIGISGMLPS